MASPVSQIEASIQAWSEALGHNPDYIRTRLVQAGVPFEKGSVIAAKDIFTALYDERKQLENEKLKQEIAKATRKNKIAEGELLDFVACEKALWTDLLAPLRQEIESMPKYLAPLLNPQQPDHAEKILAEWWEKTKLRMNQK